jgi:hypothetical protein
MVKRLLLSVTTLVKKILDPAVPLLVLLLPMDKLLRKSHRRISESSVNQFSHLLFQYPLLHSQTTGTFYLVAFYTTIQISSTLSNDP